MEQIYKKCSQLDGFVPFSSEDWQDAELRWKTGDKPPAFLNDCLCKTLILRGVLSPKLPFWPTLTEIMHCNDLTQSGALAVSVVFMCPGGDPGARRFEHVRLMAGRGILKVGYTTAIKDPRECRDKFAQVRDAAELPIEIVDTPQGYGFRHTLGGVVLGMNGSGSDIDPRTIRCDFPDLEVQEGLNKIKNIVDTLSEEVMEVYWTAMTRIPSEPESSTQLLRALLSKNLPASRYELTIIYQLTDWRTIEQLRDICKKKTRFETELCGFRVDEGHCIVSVVTTCEGHELMVELTDPETEESVERLLGLDLRQV